MHRGVIVTGVILERDRRLVRKILRLDEIAPPEFDRVDAGLSRSLVNQPLQQVAGFRPTRATVRIHRHRVCEHGLHFCMDCRGLVVAGQQGCIQDSRYHRAERRQVSAKIGARRNTQAQEIAVLTQRQFGVADVIPAVRVAHKRFAAICGPLHRAIYFSGCPGNDGFFRVVKNLGTKSTTNVRCNHPEFVLRDAEHESAHQHADDMRVLAGGVKRIFIPAAVVVADGRARLHRIRNQSIVDDIDTDDLVGTRKCLIRGCFVTDFPVETDIPFGIVPDQRCTFGAR